ncbi:hypothetical protein PLICRDRAFT_44578 [Plicaturopsis crispa FD-325 SS-3]|nr:hypothetical protein PLICRDRAFT_44578 [Plicaturopsis crispa FD-325 SS-3]
MLAKLATRCSRCPFALTLSFLARCVPCAASLGTASFRALAFADLSPRMKPTRSHHASVHSHRASVYSHFAQAHTDPLMIGRVSGFPTAEFLRVSTIVSIANPRKSNHSSHVSQHAIVLLPTSTCSRPPANANMRRPHSPSPPSLADRTTTRLPALLPPSQKTTPRRAKTNDRIG